MKMVRYSDDERETVKSCLKQGLTRADIAEILGRSVSSVNEFCKNNRLIVSKDAHLARTINRFWRDRGEQRDVVEFYATKIKSRLVNGLPQ